MPYVIVTQALPGAGKSVVSRYLERELGFVRLSPEDYYEEKLGPQWHQKLEHNPRYTIDAFKAVLKGRNSALQKGKSVVVDTARGVITESPDHRKKILDKIFNCTAEKYLLEIFVDPAILARRISRRESISLKEAKAWLSPYSWESRYVPPTDVTIIGYTNRDFEDIKNDLRDRFGERPAPL